MGKMKVSYHVDMHWRGSINHKDRFVHMESWLPIHFEPIYFLILDQNFSVNLKSFLSIMEISLTIFLFDYKEFVNVWSCINHRQFKSFSWILWIKVLFQEKNSH